MTSNFNYQYIYLIIMDVVYDTVMSRNSARIYFIGTSY